MPGTTCMNPHAIWPGLTAIIWPCGRLTVIRKGPQKAPGPKTRFPAGKFPGAIYSTRPGLWAKFFGGKASGRRTGANSGPS